MLLSITLSCQTNKRARTKAIVKQHPTDLLLFTYNMSLELPIGRNVSLQPGSSITYYSFTIWQEINAQYLGYTVSLQGRYYLHRFPTDWHLDVFTRYHRFTGDIGVGEDKTSIIEGKSIGIGPMIGCQKWIYINGRRKLLLDFYAGGVFNWTDFNGKLSLEGRSMLLHKKGIDPRLGISIGILL